MIIECPECGTKNISDKPPQPGKRYRCGKCGTLITFSQTVDTQGIFTKVPPEKVHPEIEEGIKREQVPKKRKGGCLGCLGLIVVFIVIVLVVELSSSDDNTQQTPPTQTPAETQTITENPQYIYEDGVMHYGGDGEPIELIDNPNATNVTFAELVVFIMEDTSDSKTYMKGVEFLERTILGRVCADFAEDVHNNAEAKGIRAAWVGIEFREGGDGHALNAFETTDRGLVYVDCTGADVSERFRQALEAPSASMAWDKIAYVEIGKEYGVIDLAVAKSPLYSFYEEYMYRWYEYNRLLYDYNEQINQYNNEILGKVYYEGSSELAGIEAWEAILEEQRQVLDQRTQELGDGYYESLGVVEDIFIRW